MGVMKVIESDILVIGSGIGGLFFSSKAAATGTINIITKAAIDESNTKLAQGGIACVNNDHDNFESHINDTLLAGAGYCNKEAVELMVTQAPGLIQELIEIGVKFSTEKNELNLGKEGGHSHHRIVHSTDITGSVIEQALIKNVALSDTIQTYEYFIAVKLVVEDSCCCGAIALDLKNDEYVFFKSRATVLASGGGGQAYLHTTNPLVACGDGYAIASEAGVAIADMEFVQFHPTIFHHENANGFLISEALRGAGAELVLPNGQPFMQNYHTMGSLAPRDIVSRAIYAEMKKLNLSHLFLDARSVSPTTIKEHFPNINETCLASGIDMQYHLIPVSPAAHFICGGAATDLDGCTSLRQLYAIGEVACTGVHGANRLASNSLLEGLVFAHQVSEHLKKYILNYKYSVLLPEFQMIQKRKSPFDELTIRSLRRSIQTIMWEKAGIVRTEVGMMEGKQKLHPIGIQIQQLLADIKMDRELIELKSIFITAELILNAAIKRKTNLGTHYVEPFNTIPFTDYSPLAKSELSKVKEMTANTSMPKYFYASSAFQKTYNTRHVS